MLFKNIFKTLHYIYEISTPAIHKENQYSTYARYSRYRAAHVLPWFAYRISESLLPYTKIT